MPNLHASASLSPAHPASFAQATLDPAARVWADAGFRRAAPQAGRPAAAGTHGLPDVLRHHAQSLGEHLRQCQRERSAWHPVSAVGEQVHGWIGPRFVTTLALASLGFGLLTLWPA